MHLIGCLSHHCLVVFFSGALSSFFIWAIFVLVHLLVVTVGALGFCWAKANHVTALWSCVWGKGPSGNKVACLAMGWLSFTSSATHKQIGPFWCWFPGGWVCVHSRALWVSLTNSPVKLGVSPATATSTGFSSQRFWGFISPRWNSGLCGHLTPQLFLLVYPQTNVGPPGQPAATSPGPPATSLPQVLSTPAACLHPSTSLDECFCFNSMGVRLPYSSIF